MYGSSRWQLIYLSNGPTVTSPFPESRSCPPCPSPRPPPWRFHPHHHHLHPNTAPESHPSAGTASSLWSRENTPVKLSCLILRCIQQDTFMFMNYKDPFTPRTTNITILMCSEQLMIRGFVRVSHNAAPHKLLLHLLWVCLIYYMHLKRKHALNMFINM